MSKFLEEIREQPEALWKTLNYYLSDEGLSKLAAIKESWSEGKYEQIIFTGMGSSYFIPHAAAALFNELGMNAYALNASELLHYNLPLLDRKTLLVCMSQSGESYEIIELLKVLPASVFCVGLTNEEKSTLATKSDISMLCRCGTEEKTSTKTYIACSLVAFILGWYLAGTWNGGIVSKIKGLISEFEKYLEDPGREISRMLAFFGKIQTIQVIGRGPAYSTACQSALMFREAVRTPATAFMGGEFRHGPMEMVGEGLNAILFVSKGKTFKQGLRMAGDIAGFGGKVLLICNEKTGLEGENILEIVIDEADEYLFSIIAVLPVQLFIDAYAEGSGLVAGNFVRGAKVTQSE